MTPALLLLAGLAVAEDPPADAPEPAADPAPATPVLQLGPVRSVAEKALVSPGDLHLDRCLDAVPAPRVDTDRAPTGSLELRLTVRRGKVKLVTANSVDPGLEWLTPCLSRELASQSWPVKKGEFDLPIQLGLPGEQDRGAAP